MVTCILQKDGGVKKWKVTFSDGKVVRFGASGYNDYTLVKSDLQAETKKQAYIARHHVNENWTKSGMYTAGFWSRWLLWNKRTIEASAKDIESRFGIRITRK